MEERERERERGGGSIQINLRTVSLTLENFVKRTIVQGSVKVRLVGCVNLPPRPEAGITQPWNLTFAEPCTGF